MSARIDQVLEARRIVITAGTGGVGKTTLSSAMAVRAALLGKRTVVVTIDPAKRLATSLGLDELGDHPTDLTEPVREACRKISSERAGFRGTLEAIVPDTRRTFEKFVYSLASKPEVAERVIRNPIFQIFAKEFSGTNEYMALERLYDLAQSGRYDCIVLDTPPSRNTLAFLDAPSLLARLFEERFIRWLALPANKIMAAGMKRALHVLERLTGQGFMTSLVEFSAALFEVQASFTENLKKVMALLESPQTGFVMVAGPTPDTVPEARHFIEALKKHRMNFDGIAINRTLRDLRQPAPGETLGPGERQSVELIAALQERERKIVGEICGGCASGLRPDARSESEEDALLALLPELARDVHSIEDLFHVAMAFER